LARVLELDLIQTVGFAGVALFLGYALRRLVPWLAHHNIPAPVLGGLLVAVVMLVAQEREVTLIQFNTTLQAPLMIAFFTTIGFGASVSMLKVGGPLVVRFLVLATLFAVIQNLAGAGLAELMGLDPLFGVMVGSVTLTGGPATGLAFAPQFEEAGVPGAASIAVAAAMGGIVFGGIIGGPICTWLIRRHALAKPRRERALAAKSAARPTHASTPRKLGSVGGDDLSELVAETTDTRIPPDDDPEHAAIGPLKNLVVILVAMWLGAWVSAGFAALGLTLPAYIGAMLVAAIIRNIDDATGWLKLSHHFIAELGAVALALFLAIALMTLKLWELADLALPLLTILLVQIALVTLVCWPVFQIMGRNYESAVMTGGFVGFMLGTTANAMAVMRTLAERYGPAPTAFLVAPLVGAFFIDFTNAIIITVFLNLLT
jgi:ESS family glutamate:Na+ symporter